MRVGTLGITVICAVAALTACGGAKPVADTPPLVAPPQPDTPTVVQVAARGIAGRTPYRMLILAGPGVSDIEYFTVYYGMVAMGWQVKIAVPEHVETRGRHGIPIPIDLIIEDAKPDQFDVLYVPGGAPTSEASAALIRAFAKDRHLATTRDGAAVVAATGVHTLRASDNEMVLVEGNQLTCALPGDLPALIHALHTYGDDQLRQEHVAAKQKAKSGAKAQDERSTPP